MRSLIPPPRHNVSHMPSCLRSCYEYTSAAFEPWDGPAAVTVTDGRYVGCVLDRNGLRPAKYLITTDDRLLIASEYGVLDIPPEQVRERGRLQSGEMIAADLEQGRIFYTRDIDRYLMESQPYSEWLTDRTFYLQEFIEHQFDDLSDYAQVTNPPIDPYREKAVMSTTIGFGCLGNPLVESPERARRLKSISPILSRDIFDALLSFGDPAPRFESNYKYRVFATNFEGDLRGSLQRLGEEVLAAVREEAVRVVVLGGGDTAMDCVRTAIREGAETVTCVYRRDATNMPGSVKEYHNAIEEGVEFFFHRAPKRIIVDDDGRLTGVEVLETCLAEPDASGRRQVTEVPCSEPCILADVLILALGFDVEDHPWLASADIRKSFKQLEVDKADGRTSHPKVFAGGDCQRGAHLAVTAAADGRRAALAIIGHLLGG